MLSDADDLEALARVQALGLLQQLALVHSAPDIVAEASGDSSVVASNATLTLYARRDAAPFALSSVEVRVGCVRTPTRATQALSALALWNAIGGRAVRGALESPTSTTAWALLDHDSRLGDAFESLLQGRGPGVSGSHLSREAPRIVPTCPNSESNFPLIYLLQEVVGHLGSSSLVEVARRVDRGSLTYLIAKHSTSEVKVKFNPRVGHPGLLKFQLAAGARALPVLYGLLERLWDLADGAVWRDSISDLDLLVLAPAGQSHQRRDGALLVSDSALVTDYASDDDKRAKLLDFASRP